MNIKVVNNRPRGVTFLACFFVFGVVASGLSLVSILNPGGLLEPMWRLNPTAREHFARLGLWSAAILGPVCLACAASAYGFFKGRPWAYQLGISLLVINLLGDLLNAGLGIEPRALVGIPIVASILWYLSSKDVKEFFGR